jgi:hypothetical protein
MHGQAENVKTNNTENKTLAKPQVKSFTVILVIIPVLTQALND